MEVTIEIPAKLVEEARAHGVSVELYVQQILERQFLDTINGQSLASTRAAIDQIRDLRRGSKLAGLRTKDLISEGRKY